MIRSNLPCDSLRLKRVQAENRHETKDLVAMNNFSNFKEDLSSQIREWKYSMVQYPEDWEDMFEDIESVFLLQLNPDSSHYDSILDSLEEDGMRSYEYWFINNVSYRLVGFYEELSAADVDAKLQGLGEAVAPVDLDKI